MTPRQSSALKAEVRLVLLKARVLGLQDRVDAIRAIPGGRERCGDYGDLIGRLARAREALMVAQDPAMAAYLGR